MNRYNRDTLWNNEKKKDHLEHYTSLFPRNLNTILKFDNIHYCWKESSTSYNIYEFKNNFYSPGYHVNMNRIWKHIPKYLWYQHGGLIKQWITSCNSRFIHYSDKSMWYHGMPVWTQNSLMNNHAKDSYPTCANRKTDMCLLAFETPWAKSILTSLGPWNSVWY